MRHAIRGQPLCAVSVNRNEYYLRLTISSVSRKFRHCRNFFLFGRKTIHVIHIHKYHTRACFLGLSMLYTDHPCALLPKTSHTLTILEHSPTVHMSFTIFPLTSPPADVATLLEHITPLFALVSVANMATTHICWEPCADKLDSLAGHIREVSKLKAVVVGVCGIIVRRADGVVVPTLGLEGPGRVKIAGSQRGGGRGGQKTVSVYLVV